MDEDAHLFAQAVSWALSQRMAEAWYSVRGIAADTGLSASSVRTLLRGKEPPSCRVAASACQAVGLDIIVAGPFLGPVAPTRVDPLTAGASHQLRSWVAAGLSSQTPAGLADVVGINRETLRGLLEADTKIFITGRTFVRVGVSIGLQVAILRRADGDELSVWRPGALERRPVQLTLRFDRK